VQQTEAETQGRLLLIPAALCVHGQAQGGLPGSAQDATMLWTAPRIGDRVNEPSRLVRSLFVGSEIAHG